MTTMPVWLLPLLCLLAACSLTTTPEAAPDPDDASPWTDAAGDTSHPELAALCVDLWEFLLVDDPIEATREGDARHFAGLPDRSPAGRAARRARLDVLYDRARRLATAGDLVPADRVTAAMAEDLLRHMRARDDARLHRWLVDPAYGVHIQLMSLAFDQPAGTSSERDALRRRWASMPAYVDAVTDGLRDGLAAGLVSPRAPVERAVAQLERLLGQDCSEWPLATPGRLAGLSPAEAQSFREDLTGGLRRDLRPAFVRLRDLLAQHILPVARGDDRPGLLHLPDGRRTYDALVAEHTGLDLDAETIHALGREQVAAVRAEIASLGARLFGTDDLAALARILREDARHAFDTRDEVEAQARTSLARAEAAVPAVFGRLPRAPCVVVRVPEHEERDTTIAYYRGPAADGSVPGRYFINTFEPPSRPRFDAQVLAFHEAVPGHHLQIALAQELPGVPRFQRAYGSTAFVEGWALYAERLSDELGLYGSDLDRLGMLSFDAWRACRLVVDTGIHALGMTRDEAVAYMLENTLLDPANVVNEVDRYIAHPGQALAYKLGQIAILRLRALAEARLGARFDLSAFHDVVLGSGAVTLPILDELVEAWIVAHDA